MNEEKPQTQRVALTRPKKKGRIKENRKEGYGLWLQASTC